MNPNNQTSTTRSTENVNTAFELLLEQTTNKAHELNREGALAFENGEYDDAAKLGERGKRLANFNKKISDLQLEWLNQFDRSSKADEGNNEEKSSDQNGPELLMSYGGSHAIAMYNLGWVVLKVGSTIRNQIHDSLSEAYSEMRRACLQDGRLELSSDPELLQLTEDIRFNSPSGAAQFVAGCSVSGNREWKLADGGDLLGTWLRNQSRLRRQTK